jgi:Trypsin-co-occurring domain 1
MSALISVPSASGDILIEVDRPSSGSPVTRGGGIETVQKAAASFEDGWSRVKPVANQIIKQLGDTIEGTEEVKVKFGVKFSADAGVFIASAGTEANFTVEITGHKPPQSG